MPDSIKKTVLRKDNFAYLELISSLEKQTISTSDYVLCVKEPGYVWIWGKYPDITSSVLKQVQTLLSRYNSSVLSLPTAFPQILFNLTSSPSPENDKEEEEKEKEEKDNSLQYFKRLFHHVEGQHWSLSPPNDLKSTKEEDDSFTVFTKFDRFESVYWMVLVSNNFQTLRSARQRIEDFVAMVLPSSPLFLFCFVATYVLFLHSAKR